MVLLIVTTAGKGKEKHVYAEKCKKPFLFILLPFLKDFVHSANICYTRVTTFHKTNYLTTNRTFFSYLLSCMTTFYTRYYVKTSFTRSFKHPLPHVLRFYQGNYLKRTAFLPNYYYHTWPTLYKSLRTLHVFRTSLTIYQFMLLCLQNTPYNIPVYDPMSSEQPLQYISLRTLHVFRTLLTIYQFTNPACLQNTPYNISVYDPMSSEHPLQYISLWSYIFRTPLTIYQFMILCLQNNPYNISVYDPMLYPIHQVTLGSHKFSRPYSHSD
jgi:hypothetical protein